MRFPRMTTRRWMVVAAVAALTITSVRLGAVARISAAGRASHTPGWWRLATTSYGGLGGMYGDNYGRLSKRGVAYHAAMARKYRQATRYPFGSPLSPPAGAGVGSVNQ